MSKKKVILSTIALLFVMLVAVSVVSYSITKRDHGDSNEIAQSASDNLGAGVTGFNYITNIDLIIENADKNGETFNVVEIVPAGTESSDLKSYIEDDDFSSYVLWANRKKTSVSKMPTNMVSYNLLKVSSTLSLTSKYEYGEGTVQELLDSADLIYLSSPSITAYDGGNNMNDEIYNKLHLYALGSNKPLIMDFVTSSSTGEVGKTYGSYVVSVLNNYVKYRTYAWNTGITAANFFAGRGSYYIDYYVNDKNPTGKILVISKNGSTDADSLSGKMDAYGKQSIRDNAYYGLDDSKPDKDEIEFVHKKASELTVADLTYTDASGNSMEYDYVVIEYDAKDVTIDTSVYTALKQRSEAGKYIIYDGQYKPSDSSDVAATNNYLKLMKLLFNESGVELKTNVLGVSYGYFTSLKEQGANGTEGAKAIADLINNTIYRDTDTTGATGRKFRVLEIQPCYPIDIRLAKTRKNDTKYAEKKDQTDIYGSYYNRPNEVLQNTTKDEVPDDVDYYAFEVSRAKIAHATQIDYNQIEVEQMSVNELISSKEVILESYDLVYIGGDASALLPHRSINYAGDSGYTWDNVNTMIKAFTAYDMYTHTGHFVDYQLAYNRIGSETNSVAFNGYDLNSIKKDELIDYVDAGLPIIIDETVATAFTESWAFDPDNEDSTEKNRLKQLGLHNIDPDSFMYQFLQYAYQTKKNADTGTSNVGWGIINSNMDTGIDTDSEDYGYISLSERKVANVKDGVDRAYGNTLGSEVTVYREACEKDIVDLINLSADRPTLTVTDYPMQYVEGDASTTNIGTTVKFKAGVKVNSTDTSAQSGSYTIELFIDQNGDGIYADNERCGKSVNCAANGSVDLSYKLNDNYFGLVNWKLKATAPDGVLSDVATGNAFFKAKETLKKQVRVLQVMPVDENVDLKADTITDGHSVYFCTECQQAGKILVNNIVHRDASAEYGLKSYDNSPTILSGENTVTVGKHEHDFGIVIYDSVTDRDNWETNFARSLTHGPSGTTEDGEYDFDIDIMPVGKFDTLCKEAVDRDDLKVATAEKLAEEAYAEYEAILDSPTLTQYRISLEKQIRIAVEDLRTGSSDFKNKSVVLEGFGTAEKPGQWMIDRQYHKFWKYFGGAGTQGDQNDIANFKELRTAYHLYQQEYDKALTYMEQYRTNMQQAGNEDTWLLNNYDIIILGLADEFMNKDLSVTACTQLRTYTEEGGSIMNSHDTLSAKKDCAVNMSNELRETFGMDRFHVLGISNDSTVLNVGLYKHTAKQIYVGFSWSPTSGGSFTVDKKDVTVHISDQNTIQSVEETGEEKNPDEPINVTFIGGNQYNVPHYKDGDTVKSLAGNSTTVVTIEQGIEKVVSSDITVGSKNISGTFDVGTGTLTTQEEDTEVGDDGILVSIKAVSGENVASEIIKVVFNFRGQETAVQPVAGVASTNVSLDTYQNMLSTEGSSKYRQYVTKNSSKYFWTERLQVADGDYATFINNNQSIQGYIHYNAPVGITDLFAAYDSESWFVSPYAYASMAPESFDHDSNVNGYNYEAKYGTRKADKVNDAGVTLYPFMISDELLVSPTHGQTFALDLEDPSVAVWYTLAPTIVNDGPNVASTVKVDAETAKYVSSLFAASPKDGMNNYFLYSKDNVFYTGAGHQLITGSYKDNNDERRLFINVIVNSVTRGLIEPTIKLYNKCEEGGPDHENCDDNYVDPDDKDANKEVADEMHTLFYNEKIEMYQYNIEETETDTYPEFDFKAIAGTAKLKEIQVFYDLNYGADKDAGMDYTDTYSEDDNHVMIQEYTSKNAANMSEIRVRLNKNNYPKTLKLNDGFDEDGIDYYENYKTHTYIVIRVKDEKNKWTSARIKINVVPHLFDLTDASDEVIDLPKDIALYDKKQFNI